MAFARSIYLLPAVCLIAAAQGLTLRIETETGRTQFRMGETIGVNLIFETPEPIPPPDGLIVTVMGRNRSVLGFRRDRFAALPETGVSDPMAYRLSEGIAYSGTPGMFLHDRTTVAPVDLNQWLRFDRPGHYQVRASFHATGFRRIDMQLESNEIGIDIVAADPEWQAAQLREALANPTSEAAWRIGYLDTPASVREAARLLGTADDQTALTLMTGLRGSRHRTEAVAALRELMRSPDQPVTPIFLDTLARLDPSQRQPDLTGIVAQKRGAAKAISIRTMLLNMPAEAVPANLRSDIAALFQQLPAAQRCELLSSQWNKVAGPEMIPVLRRIYDADPPAAAATALERLYELDPGQARPLLLEEIARPSPRLPFRTLAILPDATLPALDQTLLDHLEHNGGSPAAELIARYATAAILDGVKAWYARRDKEMRARTSSNAPNIASPVCEPPLVAYFLRVDPAWGEIALRQALAERGYPMGGCWTLILGAAAPYTAGEVWEKVASEALRDPAVIVKVDAVTALGRFGSPESAPALFEAFSYWHDWWKRRPAELNDENRRLEQVFVEATARAKNRVATGAELDRIRTLCITEQCRAQAEEYRREARY